MVKRLLKWRAIHVDTSTEQTLSDQYNLLVIKLSFTGHYSKEFTLFIIYCVFWTNKDDDELDM